ncbi:MAG TPA: hypothetical protein VMF66_04685 [Candidatus Acidoferrum sp.]|nr:hypothetical protein [Candidatus Acidoferrum sp.]
MGEATICNEEMERVANLLVADLGRQGLLLNYAPDTLKTIDRLLLNYGSGPGNGDKNMGLVELIGAYFGEVVRRRHGGDWFEKIPPDGATGLRINENCDLWLWCHSIVYKQLEVGNKSLHGIYEEVGRQKTELGI